MNQYRNNSGLPPVWFYTMVTTFRNFLKKLYFKLVPPNVAVYEKATDVWISKAIGVACELNLADIIGNGEKTIDDIAQQSQGNPVALTRLMRALAGEGVFKEKRNLVFVNTPLSKALMDEDNGMKYMVRHQLSETNFSIINEMTRSIRTGKSVAHDVLGMDIFTFLEKNPDKNELYNKAMTNTSRLISAAVLSSYDFKGIHVLVDLGGGEGTLLFRILQKYPDINGIVFDLPQAVISTKANAKKFGVEKRIKIDSGDFFDGIPIGGDAYLLKNILHIFNDDASIRLLKIIHEAMLEKGRVLLVESVIKNDNKPAYGKILDLQMLTGTENGKERTEKEFRALFGASGFTFSRIVKTVSPFSIIEAVKN